MTLRVTGKAISAISPANWLDIKDRQGEGEYKSEDIDPHLCTHIIYAFATLRRYVFAILDMPTNNGWTVVQDSEGAMGLYAYGDNQWTSFDDVDAIR